MLSSNATVSIPNVIIMIPTQTLATLKRISVEVITSENTSVKIEHR